jgi:hypothetical protein
MRGDGAGWLRWSGKSATPRGTSLKWVGAPGPAEEERGRLVRSGDGELVGEIGAEAVASLLVDDEARGADKMHGRVFFYSCEHRHQWDGSGRWLELGRAQTA